MTAMQRLASLFLFSLVALGCAPTRPDPASALHAPAPPYTLERFRDDAKIVDGVQTLVVDNPYGEITVRKTSASVIAWEGVEQRIGAKPRIARIEPFHEGVRQGVRVRYPGLDPNAPANPRLGRVDLYVFVPAGYNVDLRSDFGTITARKIEDDIRARSRSGMIVTASRGSVDLESQTGEIRAFAMQGLGSKPSRLVTQGNILADIPVFDDLSVEVKAAGKFRSSFALDSQTKDTHGNTVARWKHGSGTNRMFLHSGADVVLQTLDKPIP